MSRLIDADDIKLPADLPYKDSVRRVLLQAPTVDAVKVVRCKDCKWRDTRCCPYMQLIPPSPREDYDYCSDGEREDNETC